MDVIGFLAFEFQMSISPLAAQVPYFSSVGNIQIAGQSLDRLAAWRAPQFAVLPIASMLSADTSGGIGALGAGDLGIVFMRSNMRRRFHANVFGAIGINLEFMVAAAKGVFLNTPLGVVEFSAVEFIRPNKFPVTRKRGGEKRE